MSMTDIARYAVAHAATIQACLFGAVIVGCWRFEHAVLSHGHSVKRHRAGVNAWFAVCAFPIQIAMTAGCIAVSAWTASAHWGLSYMLPYADSPWVRYGVMFIVLDFLDYVYHVSMHHVPLFWRFHLVHHSDPDVDASTTVREHPGETVVRNMFLIVWTFLCGAPIELLVMRQSVETVANILSHTSFRLQDRMARLVGLVFITPNLHHVHHHEALPYTNRNYGDVFSIWDRLFGTLATLRRDETVFGLDTQPTAPTATFLTVVTQPLGRRQMDRVRRVLTTAA